MNKEDEKILEDNDWEIVCESPFEIRHKKTGDFGSGEAAYALLYSLEADQPEVKWFFAEENRINEALKHRNVDANYVISIIPLPEEGERLIQPQRIKVYYTN